MRVHQHVACEFPDGVLIHDEETGATHLIDLTAWQLMVALRASQAEEASLPAEVEARRHEILAALEQVNLIS